MEIRMNNDQIDRVNPVNDGNAVKSTRKTYSNPQLLVYGALRDLTSGGSKGPGETGTGMNAAKQRP
jgi:hypothetical protein